MARMVLSEPHGPIKITPSRQISLPKALLDRLRLAPGDRVHLFHQDRDDTLVVVPVERVSEWVRIGRAAADHHTAAESSGTHLHG